MISLAERVILMSFVRDWYAATSNEYTGEMQERLRRMSRAAGEVFNELYGMYDERTGEGDAAD